MSRCFVPETVSSSGLISVRPAMDRNKREFIPPDVSGLKGCAHQGLVLCDVIQQATRE